MVYVLLVVVLIFVYCSLGMFNFVLGESSMFVMFVVFVLVML